MTTDPATGKVSRSSTAVAEALVPASDLAALTPAAYAGVPQQPGAHHDPLKLKKDARPRRRALHRAARLREAGARDRLWPARTGARRRVIPVRTSGYGGLPGEATRSKCRPISAGAISRAAPR